MNEIESWKNQDRHKKNKTTMCNLTLEFIPMESGAGYLAWMALKKGWTNSWKPRGSMHIVLDSSVTVSEGLPLGD